MRRYFRPITCGALRGASASEPMWRFGTMPNAPTGETPYIQQRRHYGRRSCISLRWHGKSPYFLPWRPTVAGREQKSRHRGVSWATAPVFLRRIDLQRFRTYLTHRRLTLKTRGMRQSAKIRPITRATLAANARFPPTVPQVLSQTYPNQVTQLDRSFTFTFMLPLANITGK